MKKAFCVIGIIAGIATVIMGVFVLRMSCGRDELSYTSFGGDFYTYSYKATREAAENVYALTKVVRDGFG